MAVNKIVLLVFFAVTLNNNVENARILGNFPVPSKSHHILGSKLLLALAERGHEVTMISPYPFKEKIKNYRDIYIEEMHQFKQDKLELIMKHNTTFWEKTNIGMDIFLNMSEILLSHKEIAKLKQEQFDLIIQYGLFTECQVGLAYHFNAPVILFSTLGSLPLLDKVVGNPAHPAYITNFLLNEGPDGLSFWQRLFTAVFSLANSLMFAPKMDQQQQELLSKFFPDAPSLSELMEKHVALVFLNTHYSIQSPRPYVPNMIPIGGFHVQEPKKLNPDLQQFLDGATNGAIYFSLGSNVKIQSLPKDKIDAILNVLKSTNMRVLFKTEEQLEGLSENIKIGKWMPQNDILAHPNLKLFISHGGLLSTIEAVYFGVPILGIPIFGDQERNINTAVNYGYALKVEINDLTETTFSEAVNEILTNPSYRENIQLRSSLMTDQELKPLDKAIYWVEHVLKHKGAKHLKNLGTKLNLFQYLLLDVVAFVLAVLAVVSWICYKILKKIKQIIVRLFCRDKSKRD